MTEPVSRRRLLGGVLALGALGAATGLGASGCGTIASPGTRVRFWNRPASGGGRMRTAGSTPCRWTPTRALALLGGLPLLIVHVLFQRRIVRGIAHTGLGAM